MAENTSVSKWQQNLFIAGLVTGTLILVFIAYISVTAVSKFQEATEWRTHSSDVLATVRNVMEKVVTSEASQRGFLLTEDPVFLAPFHNSLIEMPAELSHLIELVSDNTRQSERVLEFQKAVRIFGAYLSDTIQQAQRGDFKGARIRVAKHEGKLKGDKIRELYTDFVRSENQLLAIRSEDQQRKFQSLSWVIPSGLSVSILLIFAAIFFLLHEFRRRSIIQKELVISRAHALETSQAKTAFLANMSHEIRTPMNGIMGMTELLEHTKLNPEQHDYLQSIRDSSRALLTLVNDILDISKIESGKLELERSQFSFPQLVDSLKGIFEYTSRHKGIPLVLNIDPQLPTQLIGDPLRLRQVLVNLVGNAFKFSNKGEIKLTIERKENYNPTRVAMRVTVADQGIGFDPTTREKLFSTFSQADVSTTRKFGGTGLGLSISKELIEMMGGKLDAQGKLSEGATFWFDIEFDIGNKTAEKSVSITNQPHLQTHQAATVLVVEDNLINQKVALGMLDKMGHQAKVANDGIEALELLEKENFDIILMDGHMPNLDGYQTTTRIRNSGKKYYNIPIIATTANAIKGEKEKVLEIGMDDYISKPMAYEDLYNKIEAHLKMKRVLAEKTTCDLVSQKSLVTLSEIQGGKMDLVQELAKLFEQSMPQELENIRNLMAEGKWDEIQDLGHRLKSSCRTLGLLHMGELCENIEKEFAHLNEMERNKTLINLERCFKTSIRELKITIEELQSGHIK